MNENPENLISSRCHGHQLVCWGYNHDKIMQFWQWESRKCWLDIKMVAPPWYSPLCHWYIGSCYTPPPSGCCVETEVQRSDKSSQHLRLQTHSTDWTNVGQLLTHWPHEPHDGACIYTLGILFPFCQVDRGSGSRWFRPRRWIHRHRVTTGTRLCLRKEQERHVSLITSWTHINGYITATHGLSPSFLLENEHHHR